LKKYLIDTNVAIYYMKGRFKLNENFDKISTENYFNCFTNILCNPVENGLNQNHQEFYSFNTFHNRSFSSVKFLLVREEINPKCSLG